MSSDLPTDDAVAAAVAEVADDSGNLPVRKRMKTESSGDLVETSDAKPEEGEETPAPAGMTKAREIRLEQNRKAARESRRRKKVMIEELQRSVIFFSRANGTLKQQNDELNRLLMQAQAQVQQIESGGQPPAAAPAPQAEQQQQPPAPAPAQEQPAPPSADAMAQQVQANAVATQAIYEAQGFPSAAARAAAQTMNAPATGSATTPAPANGAPGPAGTAPLPAMQTGATMQAMANFQQAATAAMQASMTALGASNPGVANAVAANTTAAPYSADLNALAMQQAAQFAFLPGMQPGFMAHPAAMQLWGQQAQQQQQQQQGVAQAPAPPPAEAAPAPQEQPAEPQAST